MTPPPDVSERAALRIYYHGKLSLVAAVIGCALGLGSVFVWQPLLLIALFWFAVAGWHIGNVIWWSMRP